MSSLRRSQRKAAAIDQRPAATQPYEPSQLSPNRLFKSFNEAYQLPTTSKETSKHHENNDSSPSTPLPSPSISPTSVKTLLTNQPTPQNPLTSPPKIVVSNPTHTLPLLSLAFPHSLPHTLSLCHHLIALKTLVTTSDGEPLTNDTITLILKHHYQPLGHPLECTRLWTFLWQNRREGGNEVVEGIWREVKMRFGTWTTKALRVYWAWMGFMKGVWER